MFARITHDIQSILQIAHFPDSSSVTIFSQILSEMASEILFGKPRLGFCTGYLSDRVSMTYLDKWVLTTRRLSRPRQDIDEIFSCFTEPLKTSVL